MITNEQKTPIILSSTDNTLVVQPVQSAQLNTPIDINQTTIQLFEKEIQCMKMHIEKEENKQIKQLYTMSKEIKQVVRQYGKHSKKHKQKAKKPYEKNEYTKGMSNFIAFISQIMPMCSPQKKIHRRFLVLLWDIYKGVLITWFDDNDVSKEKAVALGKDKYIKHLQENVVSSFQTSFPQIIQKLELYDDTQDTDTLRVKIINQHQEDLSSLSMTPSIYE